MARLKKITWMTPVIRDGELYWKPDKKGIWACKADVAPYIKEARPTVRRKPPVQQRKADICPQCKGLMGVETYHGEGGLGLCYCGETGKRSAIA